LQPTYLIILIMFLIIFITNRRQKAVVVRRLMQKRKKEDNVQMVELAKRFIGKECIVYSFSGSQYTGTVREVSASALLLETGGSLEAVNLDFVARIREYPRNKNGKKKSVVLD